MIRFCRHIFSRDSLYNWFRESCRCPVCRYDIRTYNLSSSSLNTIDSQSNIDSPILQLPTRRIRSRHLLNDISNNSINTLASLLLNELHIEQFADPSNNLNLFGIDIV